MASHRQLLKYARKHVNIALGPHAESEAIQLRLHRRVVSNCIESERAAFEMTSPDWLDRDLIIQWLAGNFVPVVRPVAVPASAVGPELAAEGEVAGISNGRFQPICLSS